jgi:hypothetical protein
LVQQLIPAGAPIMVLMNPDNPNAQIDMMVLKDAARISGQPISFVRASTDTEINSVFAALGEHHGLGASRQY